MNQYLPLLFSLLLILSSCDMSLPDDAIEPQAAGPSLGQLDVPEDFEFVMAAKQRLTIQVQDSSGQLLSDVPFGLYTGPVDRGGLLLGSGATDESGTFSTEIVLSTDQGIIYAYTPYGTIVPNQMISISDGETIFQWGTGEAVVSGSRTASASTFECGSNFYQVIGNSLKKLDVLSKTYLSVGNASSNYNGIGFNSQDNFIYGMKKKGDGNIELWKINTDGSETNLGQIAGYTGNNSYKGDFDLNGNLYAPYFNNGSWSLFITDVDQTPLTATNQALTELNQVDNSHDFAYNPITDKFYSLTQKSELIELDHHALTIKVIANLNADLGNGTYGALWCDSSGNIYMSENKSGNIYKIVMDVNGSPANAVFVMQGQSTNQNDGASCPLATSPFEDTDGDGVLDGIDVYPDDEELAYASYYPAKSAYGTYAFEDLWPLEGDYDFNDLVIDYNFEYAKNPLNKISKLILRFKVKAIGAGYKNSFGISFDDLTPSQIASVSGTETSTISIAANGTENGQSSAVIMVFDDGHGLFGMETGKFINSGGTGFVTKAPYELTIEVDLTQGLDAIGTVNPFIYTRDDRGSEIHMLNYPPTDLMNTNLFNQHDDLSDPTSGKFYSGRNGLPWGLEFPSNFNHPIEKTNALNAYPKFNNWIMSGGLSDTDWYEINHAVVDSIYVQ